MSCNRIMAQAKMSAKKNLPNLADIYALLSQV